LRLLVLKDARKKVLDKLKVKGITVKMFADPAVSENKLDNLDKFEAEMKEKKSGFINFLNEI